MSRSRFARRLGLAVAITALADGALPLRHSTLAVNRAAGAHAASRERGGDVYVGVGGHSLALLSTSVAGNSRGATAGRPVRGADDGSTSTIPLPPPLGFNGSRTRNALGSGSAGCADSPLASESRTHQRLQPFRKA